MQIFFRFVVLYHNQHNMRTLPSGVTSFVLGRAPHLHFIFPSFSLFTALRARLWFTGINQQKQWKGMFPFQ